MQSQLRSIVLNPVTGLADSQNNLSLFGVAFDRNGQLQIDTDRLNDVLNNDLTALRRVLVAEGSTSDSDIEFIYQSDDTAAGAYDVSITTAAEQAQVLGTVDLSGGLAAAQTLTITDVTTDRSGSIDLEAGDDTDTIVTKINSALSTSARLLSCSSHSRLGKRNRPPVDCL